MNGTVVPICELEHDDRVRMHALLDMHFEGVTREQFDRDLSEKSAAVVLRDDDGLIRGFTTIQAYRSNVPPAGLGVICSGDTIVDPGHWGSAALAKTWIAAVRSMRDQLACEKTVWLLIVSGFRTYRFLPVFWRTFVPRHAESSAELLGLLRTLAHERYGSAFNPSTGIIQLSRPQRLRPHLAMADPGRLTDPNVRFFFDRNPGHADGDELVCLCELDDMNLTPAGRRMAFGSISGSQR